METKKFKYENGIGSEMINMCNDPGMAKFLRLSSIVTMEDGRTFFEDSRATMRYSDEKHLERCTSFCNGSRRNWVVNLNNGVAYPEQKK